MPLHNAMPYLDASVRCILDQTFEDFELVMLDDGSSDGSDRAVLDWDKRDERIRVLRNGTRSGLSRSSNHVIADARGTFIARMDADDLCHPDRLHRQIELFHRRPDAVLIGTLSDGIDHRGRNVRPRDRRRLTTRGIHSPFPHGSVMFRRDSFEKVKGYRVECEGWEDLDLFLRMSTLGSILVIPDALYSYRYHSRSSTFTREHDIAVRAACMRSRCVEEFIATRRYSTDTTDHGEARRARAEVIASVSALSVWAGNRPPQEPSLTRDLWISDLSSAGRAMVYRSLGRLNPTALRWVLAKIVRLRDLRATVQLRNASVHQWL